MKQLFFILVGCVVVMTTYSQSTKGLTAIPDTSFSVNSAYQSILKSHPESKIVRLKNSPAVKVEKNISYTSVNRKLVLDVFTRNKTESRKRPAIIILHGGGWRSGNRGMHHPLAERLAEMGYACFTPEYRLSTEALYPAALHDVKAAIRWVRKNADKYQIDKDKIVVAGHSAGGQLAALAGATNGNAFYEEILYENNVPSIVNAVIDIDGILAFIHPESGEGDDSKKISAATNWFGYTKTENPATWKKASALTHAGPLNPPILFINSSVKRMHAGREEYIKLLGHWNIFTQVKNFETAPHVFPFFDPWFEPMVKTMDNFLQKVFLTPVTTVLTVAKDGSGNYSTVQEAINSIRDNTPIPTLIYIRKGIYFEKVFLDSTKSNVTLIGEDKFNTILTYNDHTGKITASGDTINTRTSWSFKTKTPGFTAKELTFQNDAGFTAGQAVAVESDGDKAVFENCRFIGNQDVLFTNSDSSRQYFKNCYIEGTTDFIFGSSTVWFENCHIHSKKNSHITAASTLKEKEFGYIFNNCILTGDSTLHNVSLGRPWRPFAHVLYMNSYIGQHIKAEGWSNWNNTDNYLTTRYAEFNNYGPAANPGGRVKWAKQLSKEEADKITVDKVFDGWNPNQ